MIPLLLTLLVVLVIILLFGLYSLPAYYKLSSYSSYLIEYAIYYYRKLPDKKTYRVFVPPRKLL
jgi:hypothetical protein